MKTLSQFTYDLEAAATKMRKARSHKEFVKILINAQENLSLLRNHVVNEIEVTCTAKDLPEFIEVDLAFPETIEAQIQTKEWHWE